MTPPVTILAIIVVYRQLPADCSSLITLLHGGEQAKQDVRLRVLLADNTPGGQVVSTLPSSVEYRAYPENPGLAAPYNEALRLAGEQGFDWLLTLDQDTHLPADFLVQMASAVRAYGDRTDVGAVVPRIRDAERLISPFRYVGGFLPKVCPASIGAFAGAHTSALNSGSLFRVRTLQQLGGYDPGFPLHNSDTRLFQLLDRAGKRVAIANVTVRHELSILRREERMSPERYQRMLRDECRFWDRHMNWLGRSERLVRLAGRFGKGLLRAEHPAFQRVTLNELRYRLFTRRAHRLLASASGPPS